MRKQKTQPPAGLTQPLDQTDRKLRQIVGCYIVLLVLEGALRKWVLPGFSDILLLCRDPLVLLAYALAFSTARFPLNGYVLFLGGWVLVSGILTTFWGHGDLFVTLFGIRTDFLHIPFAFMIGRVLRADDVITLGRWWLWGTIPMTVLLVLQFYSPQSAWVNLGVGGFETAGFSGALGRNRPSGTFSFTTGTTLFYTLSTAFWVAGIAQHKKYSNLMLTLTGSAVLIGIPISISRSLMIFSVFTFMVGIFSTSLQRGAIARYFRLILIGAASGLIVMQLPIFDDARETFAARWERSTGDDKGGFQEAIVLRVWNMLSQPLAEAGKVPLLGYGIGAGTQVGTKLITGEEGFSLGESEWARVIGESGLALGCLFLAWRIALCWQLLTRSFTAFLKKNGLPLILLSTVALNLLIGQWGQTTVNGFVALGIGLTIASIRLPRTPLAKKDDQDCLETQA